jgi:hypothetical protein
MPLTLTKPPLIWLKSFYRRREFINRTLSGLVKSIRMRWVGWTQTTKEEQDAGWLKSKRA